jgi:N-acetylmuramoyl-L-alanine amidase
MQPPMDAMSHFRPDSRFVTHVVPSPNRNERIGAAAPEILLLHYTGMRDMQTALDRLLSRESRVSCHYFVCEDGAVLQLVAEAERAWHAGASFWERANDLNSRAIGVEIVNPGHEFGYRDFPEEQIAAVIELARDIVVRRGIRPDRVLGHSDVAPSRKDDPGERFPWRRLAEAGVGLWAPPAPIVPGAALGPGDVGEEVTALQQAFAAYGYGIAPTGVYDATTAQVVIAFQRHFRTERIDGRADPSTIATLNELLAARDACLAAAGPRKQAGGGPGR